MYKYIYIYIDLFSIVAYHLPLFAEAANHRCERALQDQSY